MKYLRPRHRFFVAVLTIAFAASSAYSQASVFGYQGTLTDGGNAANSNFQLQLKLLSTFRSVRLGKRSKTQ